MKRRRETEYESKKSVKRLKTIVEGSQLSGEEQFVVIEPNKVDETKKNKWACNIL